MDRTQEEPDTDVFVINLGSEKWFVANKVDASRYGPREPAGEVWSESGTTAYLGRVGEEARCIKLDSDADARNKGSDTYIRYLGLLSIAEDALTYLPEDCDLRGQIETALKDATETYGVKFASADK